MLSPSIVSASLPAGHAHIPYVTRFNNWNNPAFANGVSPVNGQPAFYFDLLDALKARTPELHLHAFSPMEVLNGATRLGISFAEFLADADLARILGADIINHNLKLRFIHDANHGLIGLHRIARAHVDRGDLTIEGRANLASRKLRPATSLLYSNARPDIPFRAFFDGLTPAWPELHAAYTVTRPSEAMLESMREASFGDDSRDGDETVLKLEAIAAERLGKEAAAFMPSGLALKQSS